MLCVYVFHALEAADAVSCAGEEGAGLEEVGNAAGDGLSLEGVVVTEEFRDEVDAVSREVSRDGEEVEEDGDGVGWVFSVFEGVDGSEAKLVVGLDVG